MKRIILCSDGTWNRPGIKDGYIPVKSNVELLFNCVASTGTDDNGEEVKQIKFYETGVGSSMYNKFENIFGGVEGLGIDQKIKNLYSFLVLNYKVGDELFLFGFSRGAYTIRSVAGLIRNCGILKHKNIHLLDKAYELYRNRNPYASPDSDYMTAFREKYSIDGADNTPIKFIGVWDTVGSLGIPVTFIKKYNLEKYKFHDVKLSSYIENAYHAIAIDERRGLFQPTLWEITKSGLEKNQKLEQRWFPGVHCNVGGGYKDTGLSDLALKWLIEKAGVAGLNTENPSLLDNQYYKYNPSYNGELRNSLKVFYRLFPVKRRQLDGRDFSLTCEVIDESVYKRYSDKRLRYKPGNLRHLIIPQAEEQLHENSQYITQNTQMHQ
jgi:uncharacterized protein (DUF2235 family)